MRFSLKWAVVLFVVACVAPPPARAADLFYGLGVFGGTQFHDDPVWHVADNLDWREIQARPILGVHQSDRWDLWVEGSLGYIEWEADPGSPGAGRVPHSIEAGLIGMTSYDALASGPWRLYGELGVGFGWMSETPDHGLVESGLLGFLDYGVGVKFRTAGGMAIKLGGRFHHRSCLTEVDAGVNSYGVVLSVTGEGP